MPTGITRQECRFCIIHDLGFFKNADFGPAAKAHIESGTVRTVVGYNIPAIFASAENYTAVYTYFITLLLYYRYVCLWYR